MAWTAKFLGFKERAWPWAKFLVLSKKSKDLNKVLDEGLGKLINLRELKLELQLFPSQQVNVVKHVRKLKHLQFLQLTSYPIKESWGHPKLENLSGLENLSRLELSGVIDNISIVVNTNELTKFD